MYMKNHTRHHKRTHSRRRTHHKKGGFWGQTQPQTPLQQVESSVESAGQTVKGYLGNIVSGVKKTFNPAPQQPTYGGKHRRSTHKGGKHRRTHHKTHKHRKH